MNLGQILAKDPLFKIAAKAIANIFLLLLGLRATMELFVFLGMPFSEKKMVTVNIFIAIMFAFYCSVAIYGLWKRYKYFKEHGRFPGHMK